MDAVPDEDLVVPRGLARTVAFAREARGRKLAQEFVLAELSERERLQLRHLCSTLAREGWVRDQRKFRKERGEIWAFKLAGGARVAAFQDGRAWYLTHGFRKQRQRWDDAELERAERIRWEHLVRTRGGRRSP